MPPDNKGFNMFENLNYKLNKKKQDFKNIARMVIDCQNGVIHSIFQQTPYVLVFKTTNWCWNGCDSYRYYFSWIRGTVPET